MGKSSSITIDFIEPIYALDGHSLPEGADRDDEAEELRGDFRRYEEQQTKTMFLNPADELATKGDQTGNGGEKVLH